MNLPRNIFNEVFVNGLLPNDIHTQLHSYILEKNKVYVVVVEVIIMISVICVVMVWNRKWIQIEKPN